MEAGLARRIGIVETLNAGHLGRRRTNAAGFDHRIDTLGRAGKDRFDRTVAPVPDPTVKSGGTRLAHSPSAIPDTLNPA